MAGQSNKLKDIQTQGPQYPSRSNSNLYSNVKIPYPTEGVIRSAELDDVVCPENSVQIAVNMNFDRIGAEQTRPGVATYAPTLPGSVTSLGTLNILSGNKSLFAQVGTQIYVWNGSSWTSVRTTTVTTKARYAQFLNRTWMVNGSGGDVPMSSNGGNFDTTDIPATFPKADFIQAGFDGRVWTADATKDVIYYTDIVQFNGTSFISPLTFTLSVNFISTLSPQDGESITGLFRIPRTLLVFKQNHIYRVYSSTNVDAYPAYNVGTYSQESIVQAKNGLYFFHSSGFYQFNYTAYNSQPIEISRRIRDFIQAIPRTNYGNVVGIYDMFDNIKWSIGPVTVEGVTYQNCQLRYSISTQVWTIYDFSSNGVTALVNYDDGTNLNQIVGTSVGLIGALDSGTTDFGSSISYELIDRWRSFTDMYAKAKAISGMGISTENGAGAFLEYQTESSGVNEWKPIGTIGENFNTLFPNATTIDFNQVRLRIVGKTSGVPIIFYGIEILNIQDKGFNEN
jgi:hypothetical protein